MSLQVRAADERVNLWVLGDDDYHAVINDDDHYAIVAPDVDSPDDFETHGMKHYIPKAEVDEIVHVSRGGA